MTAVDPNTCNGSDDTTFTLIVSDKPTANFSFHRYQPLKTSLQFSVIFLPMEFDSNGSSEMVIQLKEQLWIPLSINTMSPGFTMHVL